ncbi:hypothetical protein DWG18_14440 [Lysobacter sp. TY2-98]|nr:hypothetical protein DWG18_14440 [Lysobacter sp. TY2-98]
MRRLPIAACAALLAIAPAIADPLTIEPRVLTTFLDGELTIDPTGAVESYRVTGDIPEGMAAKAQDMVRQLRFEPVLADGRPARAHTIMRITLAGTPTDDGGIDVHLDNITFPVMDRSKGAKEPESGVHAEVDSKSMPDYPVIALRAGVETDVLIVVRFSRDGRITDAAVRQSALMSAGGDPQVVSKLLSEFEYQSLRAVRRWHVKVDVAEGKQFPEEGMTAVVPFTYRMHELVAPRAGDWRWETRSAKRETPWVKRDPSEPLVGVADMTGGDMQTETGNGFRLATPSGGKGQH